MSKSKQRYKKAPMWTRVAADASSWLHDNKRMSPMLWNAFEATVKSSPASKLYRSNSTTEQYDEYVLTVTEWFARSIQYLYGPCTKHNVVDSGSRRCRDQDKTMVQVLYKYSTRYRYAAFAYLFMYQMQVEHGINLAGDMHPVQFIYRSKLRNTGLMKAFSKARDEGRDPWAELEDQAVFSVTGIDTTSMLNLRHSVLEIDE